MVFQPAILILLLVLSFPRDITPIFTVTTDHLGNFYDLVCLESGRTVGPEFWRKRIYGDGLGIASALYSISSKKQAQSPLSYDIFRIPYFIFGSYGAKGGSLFASALKLINDGFKYFNIVFIIDYFDPTSPASFVCHKMLNDIEYLAKLRNANVNIYRFNIKEEISILTRSLPYIRKIEQEAADAGVMTKCHGKLYPAVDSLQEITQGITSYEILIDGIAGMQFGIYEKEDNGVPDDHRLITIYAAISYFAVVAKSGHANGATVVVNVLPSGMDKNSGEWFTDAQCQFPFQCVLSPGWPISAVNESTFQDVSIYWIFFKLPQLVSVHVAEHEHCIPPPPDSTMFQILAASITRIVKKTEQQAQLLKHATRMSQLEQNQSFTLYTA